MDVRVDHSLGIDMHDVTNTFAVYNSHYHGLFLTKIIASSF